MVVYLNKIDQLSSSSSTPEEIEDAKEMMELVEMEVRELLGKYGFDEQNTPGNIDN